MNGTIVGLNTEPSVTVTAGVAGDMIVKLDATRDGCPTHCEKTVIVDSCAVEFCGFTQGAYGNDGGSFNGVSRPELIDQLITLGDPLVVGKPGRSVTFAEGSEACVIARLPANSGATTLPIGLGDVSIDPSTCQTSPPLPLKNGKFKNVLLGQTITLSLNTRYDTDLGDLVICNTMVTQASLAGPDGLLGTDDDVLDPATTGSTAHRTIRSGPSRSRPRSRTR